MEKQRILIVDDDENIAELISLYLLKECFATEIAYTGKDALALAATFNPDLILLDIMLPDIDGYEVCTEIRKTRQTPIIMLSAKGEVFDKVLGLKLGADDYMIKPFDSNELVARVKAVLRRTVMTQAVTTAAPVSIAEVTDHQGEFVEYDGLLINMTNYTVTLDGESVEMPPKELELLYFLYRMRRYKCRYRWFDRQELQLMLRIAIPSVLQQSTVSIGMMIVQAVVNPFGTQALAGYAATMRVENVFSLIFVFVHFLKHFIELLLLCLVLRGNQVIAFGRNVVAAALSQLIE